MHNIEFLQLVVCRAALDAKRGRTQGYVIRELGLKTYPCQVFKRGLISCSPDARLESLQDGLEAYAWRVMIILTYMMDGEGVMGCVIQILQEGKELGSSYGVW